MGAYIAQRATDVQAETQRVLELLPLDASARRDQQAGTLSGGEQQMLALARAIVCAAAAADARRAVARPGAD